MKVLHLTLKKHWFELILSGKKKTEYREIKPYWNKRFIKNKEEFNQFDYIHFTNGYGSDKPYMKINFRGFDTSDNLPPKNNEPFIERCWALKLGEIFEVGNIKAVKL